LFRVSGKVELKIESSSFKEIYDIEDGIPAFKYFIDGQWKKSEEKAKVYSPIDNSLIAYIYRPSIEEVTQAIENLYNKGRWKIRDMPGDKRLSVVQRMADILQGVRHDVENALIINSGKTLNNAKGEVSAAIERLRKSHLDLRKIIGEFIPGDWSLDAVETEALIRREPYGVSLIIIPFNYPLFDAVNKLVYTILPGNAAILKPPSSDPIPSILFMKVAIDAGLPKESISLITIPGSMMKRVVSNERIGVINLTGSSETGIEVMKEAGIKQYIMELGGGDPAIVLGDADIEWASERIALAIASYTGQRCDSVKVVIGEETIYEELKNKIVKELSKFKIGDPRVEGTDIGPLIDKKSADEWEEAVNDALKNGCKLLYGGKRLNETYITPAVIECMDHEKLMNLEAYKKEIFSSLAIITSFKDLSKAIEIANGRKYGLDASIFGEDIVKIRKLIRYLEVGAIYINDIPRHGINYYPFGGRKASGIGREGIGYSIEQVTAIKSIVYNYKGRGVWDYM